jgi:hypothetical protein
VFGSGPSSGTSRSRLMGKFCPSMQKSSA